MDTHATRPEGRVVTKEQLDQRLDQILAEMLLGFDEMQSDIEDLKVHVAAIKADLSPHATRAEVKDPVNVPT